MPVDLPLIAVVVPVLVTVLTTLGASRVLRRLPMPAGHPGPEPPWAGLPRPRWLAGLAVSSLAVGLAGALLAPPATAALWWVWAGPVALLVAIDAATTWLPLSLTRVCALALLVAVVVALGWGLPPARLGVMALAAVAAFGLFRLLWQFSGGQLGYGDVRLAPMVAAIAAAVSLDTVLLGFIAGSLIGVALGLWARARGRPGGFAYGPALWVGPPVALVIQRLITG
ncbi:MAG: leader peptidase (prepilin peptidase)/N-methyltransferase [Propionibacterium sp.]|nr:leader peptidase (prepilin peptidase)/N-methyltransferase [Propionibacterium sp.]